MPAWFKKSVSILVLSLFTVNTCFADIAGMGIEFSAKPETPQLIQIDIPADLASVEEFWEAPARPNPKMILQIQNAHTNYEAQSKIRDLMSYLNQNYGFKTIFVEGASEELNPEYLKLFPDAETNKKLWDELAKRGQITGADWFLLGNEKSGVEGKGIENADLYRKNYEALKVVYSREAEVKRFLEGLEGELDKLASQTLNNETRKTISDWKKFEAGHREFIPFVSSLAKSSKENLKLDLKALMSQIEWPQLTRILVLQDMEKKLAAQGTRAQAEAERKKILDWMAANSISPKLSEGLKRLNEKDINMNRIRASSGKMESLPRFFIEKLIAEAGPKGLKFSQYPAFALYTGYLILRYEIEPTALFDEIQKLFQKLLEKEAEGNAEAAKLIELYRDVELMRKLLNLELSRGEWGTVLARKAEMAPSKLVERIKGSVSNAKPSEYQKQIVTAFENAFNFYDLAVRRDEVFYEKMAKELEKTDRAILMTGGFHTEGLREIFREKEISYGTITPRLTQVEKSNLYRNVMLGRTATSFHAATVEIATLLDAPQLDAATLTAKLLVLLDSIAAVDPARQPQALEILRTKLAASGIELTFDPHDPKAIGVKKGDNSLSVSRSEARVRLAQIPLAVVAAVALLDMSGTLFGQSSQQSGTVSKTLAERMAAAPAVPYENLSDLEKKAVAELAKGIVAQAKKNQSNRAEGEFNELNQAILDFFGSDQWTSHFEKVASVGAGNHGAGRANEESIALDAATLDGVINGPAFVHKIAEGTLLHEFIHYWHIQTGRFGKTAQEEENNTREQSHQFYGGQSHKSGNITFGVMIATDKTGRLIFQENSRLMTFINAYDNGEVPQLDILKATISNLENLVENGSIHSADRDAVNREISTLSKEIDELERAIQKTNRSESRNAEKVNLISELSESKSERFLRGLKIAAVGLFGLASGLGAIAVLTMALPVLSAFLFPLAVAGVVAFALGKVLKYNHFLKGPSSVEQKTVRSWIGQELKTDLDQVLAYLNWLVEESDFRGKTDWSDHFLYSVRNLTHKLIDFVFPQSQIADPLVTETPPAARPAVVSAYQTEARSESRLVKQVVKGVKSASNRIIGKWVFADRVPMPKSIRILMYSLAMTNNFSLASMQAIYRLWDSIGFPPSASVFAYQIISSSYHVIVSSFAALTVYSLVSYSGASLKSVLDGLKHFNEYKKTGRGGFYVVSSHALFFAASSIIIFGFYSATIAPSLGIASILTGLAILTLQRILSLWPIFSKEWWQPGHVPRSRTTSEPKLSRIAGALRWAIPLAFVAVWFNARLAEQRVGDGNAYPSDRIEFVEAGQPIPYGYEQTNGALPFKINAKGEKGSLGLFIKNGQDVSPVNRAKNPMTQAVVLYGKGLPAKVIPQEDFLLLWDQAGKKNPFLNQGYTEGYQTGPLLYLRDHPKYGNLPQRIADIKKWHSPLDGLKRPKFMYDNNTERVKLLAGFDALGLLGLPDDVLEAMILEIMNPSVKAVIFDDGGRTQGDASDILLPGLETPPYVFIAPIQNDNNWFRLVVITGALFLVGAVGVYRLVESSRATRRSEMRLLDVSQKDWPEQLKRAHQYFQNHFPNEKVGSWRVDSVGPMMIKSKVFEENGKPSSVPWEFLAAEMGAQVHVYEAWPEIVDANRDLIRGRTDDASKRIIVEPADKYQDARQGKPADAIIMMSVHTVPGVGDEELRSLAKAIIDHIRLGGLLVLGAYRAGKDDGETLAHQKFIQFLKDEGLVFNKVPSLAAWPEDFGFTDFDQGHNYDVLQVVSKPRSEVREISAEQKQKIIALGFEESNSGIVVRGSVASLKLPDAIAQNPTETALKNTFDQLREIIEEGQQVRVEWSEKAESIALGKGETALFETRSFLDRQKEFYRAVNAETSYAAERIGRDETEGAVVYNVLITKNKPLDLIPPVAAGKKRYLYFSDSNDANRNSTQIIGGGVLINQNSRALVPFEQAFAAGYYYPLRDEREKPTQVVYLDLTEAEHAQYERMIQSAQAGVVAKPAKPGLLDRLLRRQAQPAPQPQIPANLIVGVLNRATGEWISTKSPQILSSAVGDAPAENWVKWDAGDEGMLLTSKNFPFELKLLQDEKGRELYLTISKKSESGEFEINWGFKGDLNESASMPADKAELKIGRVAGNDIVISGYPNVSREHLVLSRPANDTQGLAVKFVGKNAPFYKATSVSRSEIRNFGDWVEARKWRSLPLGIEEANKDSIVRMTVDGVSYQFNVSPGNDDQLEVILINSANQFVFLHSNDFPDISRLLKDKEVVLDGPAKLALALQKELKLKNAIIASLAQSKNIFGQMKTGIKNGETLRRGKWVPQSNEWPVSRTPLSEIGKIFNQAVRSALRVKTSSDTRVNLVNLAGRLINSATPEKPAVIMDWGSGAGTLLREWANEFPEQTRARQVIWTGFSNTYYDDWKSNPDIQFILDEAENIANYPEVLPARSVDLIVSYMGMYHLPAQQIELAEYLNRYVHPLMKTGGMILTNLSPEFSSKVAKDSLIKQLSANYEAKIVMAEDPILVLTAKPAARSEMRYEVDTPSFLKGGVPGSAARALMQVLRSAEFQDIEAIKNLFRKLGLDDLEVNLNGSARIFNGYDGTSKYGFRIDFGRVSGRSLSLMFKLERAAGSIPVEETDDLKKINPNYVPIILSEGRTADGLHWMVEEFIDGVQFSEVLEESELTMEEYAAYLITVLGVGKDLNFEPPSDIRHQNFIWQKSQTRMVLIDLGGSRFDLENDSKHRVYFLYTLWATAEENKLKDTVDVATDLFDEFWGDRAKFLVEKVLVSLTSARENKLSSDSTYFDEGFFDWVSQLNSNLQARSEMRFEQDLVHQLFLENYGLNTEAAERVGVDTSVKAWRAFTARWVYGLMAVPSEKGNGLSALQKRIDFYLNPQNQVGDFSKKKEMADWINQKVKAVFPNAVALDPEQVVILKSSLKDENSPHGLAIRALGKIVFWEDQLDSQKRDLFEWTMVHESLHLIFPNLLGESLNEAVTEYLTGKILGRTPYEDGFEHDLLSAIALVAGEAAPEPDGPSSGYYSWFQGLTALFERFPGLESAVLEAYQTGDYEKLKDMTTELSKDQLPKDFLFYVLINLDKFENNGRLLDVFLLSETIQMMLTYRHRLMILRNEMVFDLNMQGIDISSDLEKIDGVIKKIDGTLNGKEGTIGILKGQFSTRKDGEPYRSLSYDQDFRRLSERFDIELFEPVSRSEMRSFENFDLLLKHVIETAGSSKLQYLDLDTGTGSFIPAFIDRLQSVGGSVQVEGYLGAETIHGYVADALKPRILGGTAQIEEDYKDLPKESFDLITVNNIESSPHTLIERASELLKPGGFLLVSIERFDHEEGAMTDRIRGMIDSQAGLELYSEADLLDGEFNYPQYASVGWAPAYLLIARKHRSESRDEEQTEIFRPSESPVANQLEEAKEELIALLGGKNNLESALQFLKKKSESLALDLLRSIVSDKVKDSEHDVYKIELVTKQGDSYSFYVKRYKADILKDRDEKKGIPVRSPAEAALHEEKIAKILSPLGLAPEVLVLDPEQGLMIQKKGGEYLGLDVLTSPIYFQKLAFALGQMHGAGVSHGDLGKSGILHRGNILGSSSGWNTQAAFIDFEFGVLRSEDQTLFDKEKAGDVAGVLAYFKNRFSETDRQRTEDEMKEAFFAHFYQKGMVAAQPRVASGEIASTLVEKKMFDINGQPLAVSIFSDGSIVVNEARFNPNQKDLIRIGRGSKEDVDVHYSSNDVSRVQAVLSFNGRNWVLFNYSSKVNIIDVTESSNRTEIGQWQRVEFKSSRTESREEPSKLSDRAASYALKILDTWYYETKDVVGEGGQKIEIETIHEAGGKSIKAYQVIYSPNFSSWGLLLYPGDQKDFDKGGEVGRVSIVPTTENVIAELGFPDERPVLTLGRSLDYLHQGQGLMFALLEQVLKQMEKFASEDGEPMPYVITDIINLPTVMNAAYAVPEKWTGDRFRHFRAQRQNWADQVFKGLEAREGAPLFAKNGKVIQQREYAAGTDSRHIIESHPSVTKQISDIQQDARDIVVEYLLDPAVSESDKEIIYSELQKSPIARAYVGAGFGPMKISPIKTSDGLRLYFVFDTAARSEMREWLLKANLFGHKMDLGLERRGLDRANYFKSILGDPKARVQSVKFMDWGTSNGMAMLQTKWALDGIGYDAVKAVGVDIDLSGVDSEARKAGGDAVEWVESAIENLDGSRLGANSYDFILFNAPYIAVDIEHTRLKFQKWLDQAKLFLKPNGVLIIRLAQPEIDTPEGQNLVINESQVVYSILEEQSRQGALSYVEYSESNSPSLPKGEYGLGSVIQVSFNGSRQTDLGLISTGSIPVKVRSEARFLNKAKFEYVDSRGLQQTKAFNVFEQEIAGFTSQTQASSRKLIVFMPAEMGIDFVVNQSYELPMEYYLNSFIELVQYGDGEWQIMGARVDEGMSGGINLRGTGMLHWMLDKALESNQALKVSRFVRNLPLLYVLKSRFGFESAESDSKAWFWVKRAKDDSARLIVPNSILMERRFQPILSDGDSTYMQTVERVQFLDEPLDDQTLDSKVFEYVKVPFGVTLQRKARSEMHTELAIVKSDQKPVNWNDPFGSAVEAGRIYRDWNAAQPDFLPSLKKLLSEAEPTYLETPYNVRVVSENAVRFFALLNTIVEGGLQGKNVLDLGSGSGRLSLVGARGFGSIMQPVELVQPSDGVIKNIDSLMRADFFNTQPAQGQIKSTIYGDGLSDEVDWNEYDLVVSYWNGPSIAEKVRNLDSSKYVALLLDRNQVYPAQYPELKEFQAYEPIPLFEPTESDSRVRSYLVLLRGQKDSSALSSDVISNPRSELRLGATDILTQVEGLGGRVVASALAGWIAFLPKGSIKQIAFALAELMAPVFAMSSKNKNLLAGLGLQTDHREMWVDVYQELPFEKIPVFAEALKSNPNRVLRIGVVGFMDPKKKQDFENEIRKQVSFQRGQFQIIGEGALLEIVQNSVKSVLVTFAEGTFMFNERAENVKLISYSGLAEREDDARIMASAALNYALTTPLAQEIVEKTEGANGIKRFSRTALSKLAGELSELFRSLAAFATAA